MDNTPFMLRGTISRAVYGGDHMEYDVTIDGFSEPLLLVDARVGSPFPVASAIGIALTPSGLALLPVGAP